MTATIRWEKIRQVTRDHCSPWTRSSGQAHHWPNPPLLMAAQPSSLAGKRQPAVLSWELSTSRPGWPCRAPAMPRALPSAPSPNQLLPGAASTRPSRRPPPPAASPPPAPPQILPSLGFSLHPTPWFRPFSLPQHVPGCLRPPKPTCKAPQSPTGMCPSEFLLR